ncbi:MAG: PrsW family intramembrane metalloprotease [Candidatus Taylorbacteria bacterium]
MFLIIIVYIACVVFPLLFWSLIVKRVDSDNTEPVKLLLLTFGLGIGAAFLAMWVNGVASFLFDPKADSTLSIFFNISDNRSPATFFLAGPIEESLKLFLVYEVIYHRKEFDRIKDGVIYAIMCALGFSFLENTSYFFQAVATSPEIYYLIQGVVRAIASTLIHVSAASICGWYLARAKLSGGAKKYIIVGLVLASLLHGFSNLMLVYFNLYGLALEFIVSLLVVYFILRKLKKSESYSPVERIFVPNQGTPS